MGNKKSPQNHTDLDDLISELSNSDPSRRRKARYELIVQGDAAVLLLNQTLLTSFSKNARKEAAKALGEIGNSDAVYALIKALEDQNFEVRWDAAEGLIALGNTCLIPLCHELIRNFKSVWLREGAHHVLHVLLADNKADTPLTRLYNTLLGIDPETRVPAAAQTAIEYLNE